MLQPRLPSDGGDVSVVVPAYNNHTLTQSCIQTLLTVTPSGILADVIVVDDGSNDGISAQWAAAGRTFRPVFLPHNQGFSRACNAGAAASKGDVILFLNNDAFVSSNAIGAMRAAFRDPTVGIVGAKLIYGDGTLQHAGLALLAGPVSRWWHVHRRLPGTLPDANIPRDFLAVTGAALMIRRSLFDTLGGFDARYTNGWEDVDLCLRSWCFGLRVRYEPRAVITHLESATLGRTHDNRVNERDFVRRWEAHLAAAPRYPLGDVPPLAFAARPSRNLEERAARTHVLGAWTRNFGASVRITRAGSTVDRWQIDLAAALAKRRPVLEVAWGDATLARPTGARRVAFVAPRDRTEARAFAAVDNVGAWWTPTAHAYDALIEAGLRADRIHLIRVGATIGAAPPTRTGSVMVAAPATEADLLESIGARMPDVTTRVLQSGRDWAFAAVDIVITRNGGDRYGLLIPAALAAGCQVVVSSALDTALADMPGIHLVDDAQLSDAAVALIGQRDVLRAQAFAIYTAARRQLDAALATQHAAEAARAIVHGTPSSTLVSVDAAFAAHLHGMAVKA